MKIINFGSLNLDHIYKVDNFVQPGETLQSNDYQISFGGKGLNQSIAAARAGAEVIHVACTGIGGEVLKNYLTENNVSTGFILPVDKPQGHAIIQVNENGENCILLFSGSNYALTREYIDSVFHRLSPPGFVLVQNEVSQLQYIIECAAENGFEVVVNVSPFEESLKKIDYNKVSWIFVNEIEGQGLTGCDDPEMIVSVLQEKFPQLGIVLTLGEQGSICAKGELRVTHEAYRVSAVDTTAAGDTFTGYFLACLAEKGALDKAITHATAASALAVSAKGASVSIPALCQVEAFLTRMQQSDQ